MTRGQRGASVGEVLFTILLFSALLFLVWLALRDEEKRDVGPRLSRYRCLTTDNGVIPLKALIVPPDGSTIRQSPDLTSTTVRHAPMFSTWFAAERKDGFVRLAPDPMSGRTVGWVPEKQIILWGTKEALQPNYGNPRRRRFDLWQNRGDVGMHGRPGYDESEDSDAEPCPVVEADDGHYQVAMIWESVDFSKAGVDTAWTAKLDVPNDVRFFYLTTRGELQDDIEAFAEALVELRGGSNSDHPLLILLKRNANVSVGDHVTDEKDDIGAVRRVLRELRGPSRIADRQPAEIRRDAQNMRQRLQRLRVFYEQRENWNEQGFGWLPSDYLPGN